LVLVAPQTAQTTGIAAPCVNPLFPDAVQLLIARGQMCFSFWILNCVLHPKLVFCKRKCRLPSPFISDSAKAPLNARCPWLVAIHLLNSPLFYLFLSPLSPPYFSLLAFFFFLVRTGPYAFKLPLEIPAFFLCRPPHVLTVSFPLSFREIL